MYNLKKNKYQLALIFLVSITLITSIVILQSAFSMKVEVNKQAIEKVDDVNKQIT